MWYTFAELFHCRFDSLLPADAVQSPKVILSESRYEETMTDGGTQVAGEIILQRKTISRGLWKWTTIRRGKLGRPRSPDNERQFLDHKKKKPKADSNRQLQRPRSRSRSKVGIHH